MVWVRDPLPLQTANNCFFYVATCMAERLTETQLEREEKVWENFTAMFRVYAYLLVHRHARDRGVHAVTVPNVLQTWLNKNPALTESTPSSTTPSWPDSTAMQGQWTNSLRPPVPTTESQARHLQLGSCLVLQNCAPSPPQTFLSLTQTHLGSTTTHFYSHFHCFAPYTVTWTFFGTGASVHQ